MFKDKYICIFSCSGLDWIYKLFRLGEISLRLTYKIKRECHLITKSLEFICLYSRYD